MVAEEDELDFLSSCVELYLSFTSLSCWSMESAVELVSLDLWEINRGWVISEAWVTSGGRDLPFLSLSCRETF